MRCAGCHSVLSTLNLYVRRELVGIMDRTWTNVIRETYWPRPSRRSEVNSIRCRHCGRLITRDIRLAENILRRYGQ